MSNKKYYYAVVNKGTGKPLLEDHKLPVYWNKEVAEKVIKNFPTYCIVPVNIELFEKFILSKS